MYSVKNNKVKKILDIKHGHILGSMELDTVYIKGDTLSEASGYAENMELVILEGKSSTERTIELKDIAGYNFTVFLGDFTGDKKDDILIRGLYGGSAGLSYNLLYSYNNGNYNLIFDGAKFIEDYPCNAEYENNYKVKVSSIKLNTSYLIDISKEDKLYLDLIYDKDGIFKKNVTPIVYDISAVNPVDYGLWKYYGLVISQRIIGQSNADTLGILETLIRWDQGKFRILSQGVEVSGYVDSNNKFIRVKEKKDIIYVTPEKIKNKNLEKAILKHIQWDDKNKARYFYNYVDLNDNGNSDVVVYVYSGSHCTMEGCVVLVFKIEGGEYILLSKISPLKIPIVISNKKNSQYKNIIGVIDDDGSKDKYVNLIYDGEEYLENPSLGEEVMDSDIAGVCLFKEKYLYDNGIELTCPKQNNNDIQSSRGKDEDCCIEAIKKHIQKIYKSVINEEIHIVKTKKSKLGLDLLSKYIVAYIFKGNMYIAILEKVNGAFKVIDTLKGKGTGSPYINFASLHKPYYNELIIGWKIHAKEYELEVYKYKGKKLQKLSHKRINFNLIDIEDIKPKDGLYELALWTLDKDKNYKVKILKQNGDSLIESEELEIEYYKKVVKYYMNLIEREPDNPAHWYYLADSLNKTKNKEYALKAIEKCLSFEVVYPSKESVKKLEKDIYYDNRATNEGYEQDLDFTSIDNMLLKSRKFHKGNLGLEESYVFHSKKKGIKQCSIFRNEKKLINMDDLKNRLSKNQNIVLVDVRERYELYGEYAPMEGSINIPLNELKDRLNELKGFLQYDIVVVCTSGIRSFKGAEILRENGFENVYVLNGGLMGI